ncbi:DinB/UmuC family translesion DNA polymerase, partial [Vibrio azureus]
GIVTAYQLKQCNIKTYQKRYSINVANVISELNGITCLDFSAEREKKKQIWSTASYRDRLHHQDDLFAELAHHCAEVMRKIRDQKSEMKTLSVFVSTSKYDLCPPFYRRGELALENGLTDTCFALKQLRALFEDLLPDNL